MTEKRFKARRSVVIKRGHRENALAPHLAHLPLSQRSRVESLWQVHLQTSTAYITHDDMLRGEGEDGSFLMASSHFTNTVFDRENNKSRKKARVKLWMCGSGAKGDLLATFDISGLVKDEGSSSSFSTSNRALLTTSSASSFKQPLAPLMAFTSPKELLVALGCEVVVLNLHGQGEKGVIKARHTLPSTITALHHSSANLIILIGLASGHLYALNKLEDAPNKLDPQNEESYKEDMRKEDRMMPSIEADLQWNSPVLIFEGHETITAVSYLASVRTVVCGTSGGRVFGVRVHYKYLDTVPYTVFDCYAHQNPILSVASLPPAQSDRNRSEANASLLLLTVSQDDAAIWSLTKNNGCDSLERAASLNPPAEDSSSFTNQTGLISPCKLAMGMSSGALILYDTSPLLRDAMQVEDNTPVVFLDVLCRMQVCYKGDAKKEAASGDDNSITIPVRPYWGIPSLKHSGEEAVGALWWPTSVSAPCLELLQPDTQDYKKVVQLPASLNGRKTVAFKGIPPRMVIIPHLVDCIRGNNIVVRPLVSPHSQVDIPDNADMADESSAADENTMAVAILMEQALRAGDKAQLSAALEQGLRNVRPTLLSLPDASMRLSLLEALIGKIVGTRNPNGGSGKTGLVIQLMEWIGPLLSILKNHDRIFPTSKNYSDATQMTTETDNLLSNPAETQYVLSAERAKRLLEPLMDWMDLVETSLQRLPQVSAKLQAYIERSKQSSSGTVDPGVQGMIDTTPLLVFHDH